MLGTQDGDIRVDRCLQRRYARAHNKYGREKQRKADQLGGRNKKQAPNHLDKQRDHHRALVANYFNQL